MTVPTDGELAMLEAAWRAFVTEPYDGNGAAEYRRLSFEWTPKLVDALRLERRITEGMRKDCNLLRARVTMLEAALADLAEHGVSSRALPSAVMRSDAERLVRELYEFVGRADAHVRQLAKSALAGVYGQERRQS
jgi:hypothetical protein